MNAVSCVVFSHVFLILLVFCAYLLYSVGILSAAYSRSYSDRIWSYSQRYSVTSSLNGILDDKSTVFFRFLGYSGRSKKMHGFCIFSGWGEGGGWKRPQNTVFWGPRRIHGVLRILARILSVFYRITEYTEYGQNTDHVFWWTEYPVFFTNSVYSLLVDRIPYSVQRNRIPTEYRQNTDRIP